MAVAMSGWREVDRGVRVYVGDDPDALGREIDQIAAERRSGAA